MKHLMNELQLTSKTVPTNVNKLWWLARAISFGRLEVGANPGLEESLLKGEGVFEKVDPSIVLSLSQGLGWEDISRDIKSGVLDERPEDLEYALYRSETLLALAPLLGMGDEAKNFLEEAAPHLEKISRDWSSILIESALRRSHYPQTSYVKQLWDLVSESVKF